MVFPDKETVERVRKEYPPGTRVILRKMDDAGAPPIGTMGTIIGCDDAADLLVAWDNGSSLNLVFDVDYAEKMVMTDKVYKAIMRIRNSGETNMIDVNTVQRLAFDAGEYELVNYIQENKDMYVHFILFGTEE